MPTYTCVAANGRFASAGTVYWNGRPVWVCGDHRPYYTDTIPRATDLTDAEWERFKADCELAS
jgi:hypothetical protein